MRIENLRSEKNGNRVAATVIWEDCDRPAQEIYIETTEEFAQDLFCNPDAFLVACIMPAMYYGEQRIFTDVEICPQLRDGLMNVMSWIRHWEGTDSELIKIEAKTRSNLLTFPTQRRAGFLFSGGIDSLATLRANRLNYPLSHPGSIKDGLLVYGINIESDNRLEIFEQAVTALSEVAKEANIALIPVYTNIRDLNNNLDFYGNKFYGAILLAVAHTFVKRINLVYIASGPDIPNLEYPHGSHPLLDENYSSSELRILHHNLPLSRLDKTKLVAEWDVSLQNIKVCTSQWPGVNCGKCEKCLRTMTALLALGALDQTRAFPKVEITAERLLTKVYPKYSGVVSIYQELIDPLEKLGHHDLVRGIERIIKRYHEKDLKGTLKRLDRKFFNGNLIKLVKFIMLRR